MRILVTGGTGFVGSHLVERLLADGHQVVCLVRSADKAQRLFPGQPLELIVGGLGDDDALVRAVHGVDAIYHVAGLVAAPNRAALFDINHLATERVVALAERQAPKARFIYVSSFAAAGPSRRGAPRAEEDEPRPVSDYGRSKLAGEEAVRRSSLRWTVVRPPAVYGPRDIELLRVVKLARGPIVPLIGDPEQELTFVHVRDVSAALVAGLGDAGIEGLYYAGHDEIVTARDVIGHMRAALRGPDAAPPAIWQIPSLVSRAVLTVSESWAGLVGKATVLNRDKGHEFFAEAWTCSSARLAQDTGWRATIGAAEGWRETVDWYRTQGWI